MFRTDPFILIGELNNTNGLIRSYIWGLDLSGGMQGAGGVGGLLAIRPTGTNTLFAAYDGNGNVTGLIDATTGTISGQFEYGSFGETIRLTPNANNQSPFRFSTKYTDDESDSLYYGFRYYNPSTGRWLSRDPIEERGRLNLYGFVSNDPIGLIDLLGEAVLPPGFVGPPNVDDFYGTAIPDPKTPDAARADRERFGRGIMNQFADLQRLNPDKCCKLDPCSLAAQWMAESNWGRSGLAIDAKNLGGIKGRGPAGSYNAKTREFEGETQVQIRDNFRAYHNYPEFYADYANLICKADRYKNARGKKGREYYEALKR